MLWVHAAMTANHSIRSPYVAGHFYPASEAKLSQQLDEFLSGSPQPEEPVQALIVPHAGYIYSGSVAGSGFGLLKNHSNRYKRVFILGANHNDKAHGFKFSLLKEDYYETPLGKVKISDISKQLAEKYPDMFQYQSLAHQSHIVEVQLPFLQKVLKNDNFEIIPIITGEVSLKDLIFLSSLLQEYLNEETLIVVTSDLSHYHPYEEAVKLDSSCTDAITALSQEKLLQSEACGLPAIWVLTDIAKRSGWKAKLIEYKNSGDTAGDKNAVVGYATVAFFNEGGRPRTVRAALAGDPTTESQFTTNDLKPLLGLARSVLKNAAAGNKKVDESMLPDNIKNSQILKEDGAAFVTLTKHKDLRGCIGDLVAVAPLYLSVIRNTISAALYDPRFSPVRPEEVSDIEIEISVLTKPKPLEYKTASDLLNSLRVGIDGVILAKGNKKATFLPQVWDQLPDKETFLAHLCMKAGLKPDEWRTGGLQIQTYQVVSVEE